tara:strand:- start:2934 stop:5531 length:2598 start_codon:yes stop_codon:yes gene_type:complete
MPRETDTAQRIRERQEASRSPSDTSQQQLAIGDTRRDTSGQLWELVKYDEGGNPKWRKKEAPQTAAQKRGTQGSGASVPHGFLRTAAQGASFGFSDEVAGLLKGLAPGGPKGFKAGYKEGVEGEREKLHAYREQNPLKALGAEALGGIATGFGLAGGARALGARVLPKVVGLGGKPSGILGKVPGLGRGQRVAQQTRAAQVGGTGGGAGTRALSAAGVGASEGALYGVGVGEDSLKERAISGLVGGAVGGIAAPLMVGGVAATRKIKDFSKDVWRGQSGGARGLKSRQAKTDQMLAESLMREAPEKFIQGGESFVARMQAIVASGSKAKNPATGKFYTKLEKEAARKALKDIGESGDSPIVAGLLARADEAAQREAQPGNVSRLLGDATDDFAETTAAISKFGGDEVAPLKSLLDSGSRSVPLSGSLEDLSRAANTKSVGSAKKNLEALEVVRKQQASQDYADFYKAVDDWDDILADPTGLPGSPRSGTRSGYQSVMSDINRMVDAEPMLFDIIEEAFKSKSVAATIKKRIRGGKGPRGTARNLKKLLDDPLGNGPEDMDKFRRALKKAESTAAKSDDWDLANAMRDLADEVDGAISKHSKKYEAARGNFRVKSRKLDSYQKGTENYANQADLKNAHDNAWVTSKDKGAGFTKEQKDAIQAEFRQGRLDKIADDAAGMMPGDTSGAAATDFVERQFRMLFDGVDAPFASVRGTTKAQKEAQKKILDQAKANLRSRSSQAKTNKRVDNAKGTDVTKETAEVSGAVPATAGLYGLAGQFGAMGRTGIMSMIYGAGAQRKYAQNLARRLRQKESRGLLDMAETVKRTERKKVTGLLGERGVAAGGAMLPQGYPTADFSATLQGERRYR